MVVSPSCEYRGFETTESINGERLADYLDDFSKEITRPTFIVLDNASIHRKGEVAKKVDKWKQRGLYIFFSRLTVHTSTLPRQYGGCSRHNGFILNITAADRFCTRPHVRF